jgi:hypothetical protein
MMTVLCYWTGLDWEEGDLADSLNATETQGRKRIIYIDEYRQHEKRKAEILEMMLAVVKA